MSTCDAGDGGRIPQRTRGELLKTFHRDRYQRAPTSSHIANQYESMTWSDQAGDMYCVRYHGQQIPKRAALWRASVFLQKARGILEGTRYIEPMRKALDTFERHREAIIARWESMLTNARLEGLNSLFQTARARGYRNTTTFITMIYLIAAPIKELLFPL